MWYNSTSIIDIIRLGCFFVPSFKFQRCWPRYNEPYVGTPKLSRSRIVSGLKVVENGTRGRGPKWSPFEGYPALDLQKLGDFLSILPILCHAVKSPFRSTVVRGFGQKRGQKLRAQSCFSFFLMSVRQFSEIGAHFYKKKTHFFEGVYRRYNAGFDLKERQNLSGK